MIRAILFDCDGLMFNSERISQKMWLEECRKYGVTLPDDFFERISGSSSQESDAYMRSIPGLSVHLDEIRRKRFDLDFWKSFPKDGLNMPGLIELFSWCDEHSIVKAVCSSSPHAYVEVLLGTVSVPLKYSALVTGDMVRHAKPDPEIFLKGAELLHASSTECLVLEDSRQGIIAAKRAGMMPGFVEDTIPLDQQIASRMAFHVHSLKEVIPLLEEKNGLL